MFYWVILIYIFIKLFYRYVYAKGFEDGENYNPYIIEEGNIHKDYLDE